MVVVAVSAGVTVREIAVGSVPTGRAGKDALSPEFVAVCSQGRDADDPDKQRRFRCNEEVSGVGHLLPPAESTRASTRQDRSISMSSQCKRSVVYEDVSVNDYLLFCQLDSFNKTREV